MGAISPARSHLPGSSGTELRLSGVQTQSHKTALDCSRLGQGPLSTLLLNHSSSYIIHLSASYRAGGAAVRRGPGTRFPGTRSAETITHGTFWKASVTLL